MKLMLVDFSGLAHSSLHVSEKNKDLKTEEKFKIMLYHILNYISQVRMKFKPEHIVLAIDGPNNWRYDVLKYYKARRKLKKQESDIDYKEFKRFLDEFLEEFQNYTSMKIIKNNSTEGDDVIATLVMNLYHKYDKVIIVARDKDFLQLQKFGNVSQYDFIDSSMKVCNNPNTILVEKILKGDSTDDVPNVFSTENHFMLDKTPRQKSVTKEMIEVASNSFEDFCKTYGVSNERLTQNRKLVELSTDTIPKELQVDILEQFVLPWKKKSFLLTQKFIFGKRIPGLYEKVGTLT